MFRQRSVFAATDTYTSASEQFITLACGVIFPRCQGLVPAPASPTKPTISAPPPASAPISTTTTPTAAASAAPASTTISATTTTTATSTTTTSSTTTRWVAPSVSKTPAPCYLGVVPRFMLIEGIGKPYIMRPDRTVVISFHNVARDSRDVDPDFDVDGSHKPGSAHNRRARGPEPLDGDGNNDRPGRGGSHNGRCCRGDRGAAAGDITDSVFFSLSHTLGVVHAPASVRIRPTFIGSIGPSKFVEFRSLFVPHRDSLSVYDFSKSRQGGACVTLLTGLKEWPVCCSGPSWIVTACSLGRKRKAPSKKAAEKGKPGPIDLYIWRVVNGVPKAPPKVTNLPWVVSVLSLGFYGASEHIRDSDVVSMMCTGAMPDGTEYLHLLHIDLNKAVDGENLAMRTVYCLSLGPEVPNFCKPMVDRTRGMYCLPLAPPENMPDSKRRTQRMLVLNTGNTVNWFTYSPDFTVNSVDDSHMSVTNTSLTTTSVYDLSNLPTSTPSITSKTGKQPKPKQPDPCYIHHHTPGTAMITAGAGLLVESTVFLGAGSPSHEPYANMPTVERRHKLNKNYSSSCAHYQMGTSHVVLDAATGGVILSLIYRDQPVFPYYLSSIPISAPHGNMTDEHGVITSSDESSDFSDEDGEEASEEDLSVPPPGFMNFLHNYMHNRQAGSSDSDF
ncbi:hypothetical protein Pelo_17428 [Pelomyxa schiedti]|nr:hypothetical protein Pelo_17428 [Pelomyxa schiedti]